MTPSSYITDVLPKMEGWCTPAKAARLVELVESSRARVCVEIGVFGGRSLFAIALAQSRHIPALPPLTIGIDPWERMPSVAGYDGVNEEWWAKLDHDAIYASCRSFHSLLSLRDTCQLLRATSREALALVSRLAPIDLLHIDGNHSTDSALYDVMQYVPLVRPHGVVLFDDMEWETTKPAQRLLLTLCKQTGEVDGCGIFERLS